MAAIGATTHFPHSQNDPKIVFGIGGPDQVHYFWDLTIGCITFRFK